MILKSFFLAALGAFLLQAQPVGDVLTKARAKMDELSAKLEKAKASDDLRADARHLPEGWRMDAASS